MKYLMVSAECANRERAKNELTKKFNIALKNVLPTG